MTKTIHEVLLVPALGHTDKDGFYTRGHAFGTMSELDAIDRYVVAVNDELENAGIRTRTLEVRKPPGIREGLRHIGIFPHTLILHCSMGWQDKVHPDKPPTRNKSNVYLGDHRSNELANLVSETVAHWGQIYCDYAHSGAKPVVDTRDTLLTVPETFALRLEPFLMNGHRAAAYLCKLEELGADVGRIVADFILRLGFGAKTTGTNADHLPKRTPGHKISRM